MLSESKLVAFVATTNPEKAKIFYGEILGLDEVESTPYALVFHANGTTIRIQIVETLTPPLYTSLGWEVSDISTTVQFLMAKNVSFEFFDSLPQDKFGIWTTPAGAKVAWFKDTDGNTLSLTQSAK